MNDPTNNIESNHLSAKKMLMKVLAKRICEDLSMYPPEAFAEICVKLCDKKDTKNDVISSDTWFEVAYINIDSPENGVSIIFASPYLAIDPETGCERFGWQDADSIPLDGEFKSVFSYDRKVIGFREMKEKY